jgi:ubiquinone/menaquinone biosynthesis C-methylase UbiE
MRRNFPPEFDVLTGSTFPSLPYRDASIDVIYGISVFTHTKYLWDLWLAECRRVLKDGGLCIQSVQCEHAWKFYHENRTTDWVKNGHPESMLKKPLIDEEFFFFGDGSISQTFYREEVVKRYWGRIMKVVDFLPPPEFSYQNWIVLKNEV